MMTDAPQDPSSLGPDPISTTRPSVTPGRLRLLDSVRAAIRARHYSHRTEKAYVGWIRRFILFHGKRHPAEMAEAEVNVQMINTSEIRVSAVVAASAGEKAHACLLKACDL